MKITIEQVCANGYRLKSDYIERIVSTNKSIDNFERFKYWFERHNFYLTMNQFLIIDPEWFDMTIGAYDKVIDDPELSKQEALDFLVEQRELRLIGYDKAEPKSDFDRWQLAQAEMYQKVIDWIEKEIEDDESKIH